MLLLLPPLRRLLRVRGWVFSGMNGLLDPLGPRTVRRHHESIRLRILI